MTDPKVLRDISMLNAKIRRGELVLRRLKIHKDGGRYDNYFDTGVSDEINIQSLCIRSLKYTLKLKSFLNKNQAI